MFVYFILFGLALLVFVLPIAAMVRSGRAKREAKEANEQTSRLTSRIYALEQEVDFLRTARTTAATRAAEPQVQAPLPAQRTAPPAAPQPVVAAPPSAIPQQPRPTVLPISAPDLGRGLGGGRSTPASRAEAEEKWTNLEEKLGANWLNKIGTTVFVIGVALFLSYSIRHLGPAGKVGVGYLTAAVLLGAGVWGERHDRYRILSRAVLGGGWAIAYFTTYAMSHIPAVRLIDSAALGFTLLFLVAAAMVAHSLRYHSEVTTGFAYLLAFASVAVSQMSLGTLAASALLAASLTIVLWKRKWYAIEPFAIAACYLVHYLWLRQIFHALGGRKPFPGFAPSAVLLSAYWIIWMISYFLREETEPRERNYLTASFFLNAAGYLIVLHYQSFHPEWRFWFLLGAGAVYMALGPLASRRARRRGFILTTTFGAAMLAAAFPYRYSGARVEIVWLIEAETLLVAGWRLAERHLRNLGWLVAGALWVYVLFNDLSRRLVFWRAPNIKLGVTLLTLAAAYYLHAHFFPQWLGKDGTQYDADGARASRVLATFFVLAAAWIALPALYVGAAWAVVALALAETGRRTQNATFQFCAHGSAVLSASRLLSNDLPWAAVYHGLGWFTVGLAAAMFYLASRRVVVGIAGGPSVSPSVAPTLRARLGGVPAAYTWVATILGGLLVWTELSRGAIALGWALLGLLLLEAGRALRDSPLQQQAELLLAASFARIFFADLNDIRRIDHIPARVLSVVALAMIYYYAAFSTPAGDTAERRMLAVSRNAFLWFGWGALAALARFEFPLAWVAVVWAAMTVILYFSGHLAGIRTLRTQAYLLTLLAGIRCAFDNFYQTGPSLAGMNTRTVTVICASALFYVLLAEALLAKRRRAGGAAPAGAHIAEAKNG